MADLDQTAWDTWMAAKADDLDDSIAVAEVAKAVDRYARADELEAAAAALLTRSNRVRTEPEPRDAGDNPFTEEDVQRYAEIALDVPPCGCLPDLDVPDSCTECRMRAVLAALVEDGWRRPSPKPHIEWRIVQGGWAYYADSREEVDALFAEHRALGQADAQIESRRPGGPWEPVPDTQPVAQPYNASAIDVDEATRIAAERGDPSVARYACGHIRCEQFGRCVIDPQVQVGGSLGEQPHDPTHCDRGGRPHLGPCNEPDTQPEQAP